MFFFNKATIEDELLKLVPLFSHFDYKYADEITLVAARIVEHLESPTLFVTSIFEENLLYATFTDYLTEESFTLLERIVRYCGGHFKDQSAQQKVST